MRKSYCASTGKAIFSKAKLMKLRTTANPRYDLPDDLPCCCTPCWPVSPRYCGFQRGLMA